MTQTAVVYSNNPDARAAGAELAQAVKNQLGADAPDALIVFASPAYDQAALLRSLHETCRPKVMVGASSAGEFTDRVRGEGLACALALRSDAMRFGASVGRNLSKDTQGAAAAVVSGFQGMKDSSLPFRSALVMTDALAGHADELVEQLTVGTAGTYQFFGGGAGDNAQFRRTSVFFGTEVLEDSVVALELLSAKPIGVGVGHGWEPASAPLRVTQSNGMRLYSLNGLPAAQAFAQHAQTTGQRLDEQAPIPFFLHNILGIQTSQGHRLRVPLAIHEDGSITCAAEVPEGTVVHIMRASEKSAIDAAGNATRAAVQAMAPHKPKVALFFDCVATRLRLGDVFGFELKALSDQLAGAQYVGCNTHGQIARAAGQFSGFHNCTAVVCVLPE